MQRNCRQSRPYSRRGSARSAPGHTAPRYLYGVTVRLHRNERRGRRHLGRRQKTKSATADRTPRLKSGHDDGIARAIISRIYDLYGGCPNNVEGGSTRSALVAGFPAIPAPEVARPEEIFVGNQSGLRADLRLSQPTPMMLVLHIHYSRASDIMVPDHVTTTPSLPLSAYRDGFGNWCTRLVAPAGGLTI